MAKEKLSLVDRMKAQMKVNNGIYLMDSDKCTANVFTKEDMVVSRIPMLNVALSGYLDGGLMPGIEVAAAPSGTGKTSIGLELVQAFQQKFEALGEDHLTLYFDSEYGSRDIIAGYDIDLSKVLHIPIIDIEELHHNMLAAINDMKMTDNIFLFVDSVGNLSSKKELADALEGKSKVDMTRAKTLKAFFRQVTPIISLKRVYTYFIGHVYKEQGLFPKTVVSGGTGLQYAPNGRYIIGKVKIKNKAKELIGHEMGFMIDKSRSIREKSKFVFRFMYGYGLEEYSGLAEEAIDLKICKDIKIGAAKGISYKDKEILLFDSGTAKEFWDFVLEDSDLAEKIHLKYKL